MVCSISAQAAPSPNSSRPPERWSTVTAVLASTAGWRYVFPVTMQPMRTRVVASAMAASIVQASKTSSSGSPPIPAKWSKSQQWSKPASSAIRQTARSSSAVVPCPESLSPTRNVTGRA